MYYEEKVINGILFYRTDPDKEWIEMSKEDLTARYIRTKNDNCVYAQLCEGWRDANKEIPEIEQAVLVYFSGAYCVMMRLKYISPKGETVIKWSDGNRSFIGVDAWRPLPDPPAFV